MVLTANNERAPIPARNLPLITASLNIGWERITERLPWAHSRLMASNPKDKPMMGPNRNIKYMKENPDPKYPENMFMKTP